MRRTSSTAMRGGFVALGIALLVFSTLTLWRVAFQAPGDILGSSTIEISTYGVASGSVSVDGIGDLDDDGVEDLIVSDYLDPAGANSNGAVVILFMNSNGTVKSAQTISEGLAGFDYTFTSGSKDFGYSVAGVGDFDGDNVEDILVGSKQSNAGGTYAGEAFLMFLNTDGTVKGYEVYNMTDPVLSSILFVRDKFGQSVDDIGDLDGNGTTDFIIGAQNGGISRFYDEGAVYVLLTNADGTLLSAQAITTNDLPHINGDEFSRDVAGMGDMDGDGVLDVVVSASGDDEGGSNAGALYLLYLNTDGTLKDFSKIVHGADELADFSATAVNDLFGTSVANAGDLDGDGLNDLLVGARTDDSGYAYNGSTLILYTESDGTLDDTTPYTEIQLSDLGYNISSISGDFFGGALAMVQDYAGDGIPDIAALATQDSPRQLYLVSIDSAPQDSTAPTPGGSGTITETGDTETTVTIGWTKATDETSAQSALTYKVYYAADGTDLSSVANAEANGTLVQTTTDINSATISSLTGETDYEFQVVVSDEAGNKAAYTALGATSGDIPDVTAPTPGDSGTISSSESSIEGVTLTWTAATDAKTAQGSLTYKVYYGVEGTDLDSVADAEANGTLADTVTGDNNYIVTGLSSNTIYEFQLVVADASGNKAVYTQAQFVTARLSSSSPTFPANLSVQINDGASCTNSAEVTVNIEGDYIDKVVVADNDRFLGSFWEIFTGSPMNRAFTLVNPNGGDLAPGEEQSVYVIFRSWHGNKSFIHSDSIVYDPGNADCTYVAVDDTADTTDETTTEDATDDTIDTTTDDTSDTTTDDGTADTADDTTTEDTTDDGTSTGDTTDTTTDDGTADTTDDTVEEVDNSAAFTTTETTSIRSEAVKHWLEVGEVVRRGTRNDYYYLYNGSLYTLRSNALKSWIDAYPSLVMRELSGREYRSLPHDRGLEATYAPGTTVLWNNGTYYWVLPSTENPTRPNVLVFDSRNDVESYLGRSWRKYSINIGRSVEAGYVIKGSVTSLRSLGLGISSLKSVRDLGDVEIF